MPGFVAIFDLSDDTDTSMYIPKKSLTEDDIPTFYALVADTYIVAITSLSPSNPYLIGLTSFDGQVAFFDLRSPESDTFPLHRQRGTPPQQTANF